MAFFLGMKGLAKANPEPSPFQTNILSTAIQLFAGTPPTSHKYHANNFPGAGLNCYWIAPSPHHVCAGLERVNQPTRNGRFDVHGSQIQAELSV